VIEPGRADHFPVARCRTRAGAMSHPLWFVAVVRTRLP
jgi:hypothetical protein